MFTELEHSFIPESGKTTLHTVTQYAYSAGSKEQTGEYSIRVKSSRDGKISDW